MVDGSQVAPVALPRCLQVVRAGPYRELVQLFHRGEDSAFEVAQSTNVSQVWGLEGDVGVGDTGHPHDVGVHGCISVVDDNHETV